MIILTWREPLRGYQVRLQLVKVLTIRCYDYPVTFLCLEAPAPGFARVPPADTASWPASDFFQVPPLDALRGTRQALGFCVGGDSRLQEQVHEDSNWNQL